MTGFSIRAGREADADDLLEIERRAATRPHGHGACDVFAMHSLSAADLERGIREGILCVAEVDGRAAGFALCAGIDGHAHLLEMDVVPEHGRRGIGSALLEAACSEAATCGHPSITLVTLRDVPWNAPFYAGRGFSELAEVEWGAQLRGIVDRERMLGLPMQSRVVMRRGLSFSHRRS